MKYVAFLVLLLMGCRTQSTDTELQRWQAQADNVTIVRDDFGVPHIYGKSDADAVFGLLYAQCEDDFNRVEQNYIWATGRLAEVDGKDALYSDLRARLFMTKEEAIENLARSPDWLKELCQAFADGINYYLHCHPDVKPKLLTRFEPWMPMYFSEGSIGGDIERVSIADIKAFYEDPQTPREAVGAKSLADEKETEPAGSNGIAISGDLTSSGHAMLLINPHTSFYFRGEVHVVSEEGLNAYGAVTWGQFFVYQGFNEKTGWMHTSTYVDVMDEYLEDVEVRDGKLMYEYGSEWRPLEESSVELRYKDGSSQKTAQFPLYRTHHGPITGLQENQWVATAMMWEPVKALEQSYIRTKLGGHEEFRKMMDIRTNSSNNTVYADAQGNIAYYHGNFIPERDKAFDFTQPVAGDDPNTDWQGLHEVDESIVVINPPNGWIQNCNSTPFTSAGAYSPKREDYPSYMSVDQENFRGIHALRLLDTVKNISLDGLIDLAYSPSLPAFQVLIPGLLTALEAAQSLSSEEEQIVALLRDWDFTTSIESIPMSIAHYYGTAYARDGKAPKGLSRMQRILHFAKESPLQERIQIFHSAMAQLEKDFGTWQTPWGEINRFQRITGDINQPFDDATQSHAVGLASGRWGALAAYGAAKFNTNRIYGYRGNSFVAVVEFGDKVRAKSLLAGGQSGDPKSPHFDDQIQSYINAEFKDVLYYRDDVEARAEVTYQPGQRL